jgi:hypothetical protein
MEVDQNLVFCVELLKLRVARQKAIECDRSLPWMEPN